MSRVVCIHGIGHQVSGEESCRRDWLPALKDGMTRAGAPWPRDEEVGFAFYGDLFRKRGTMAVGLPPLTAADLDDPYEQELLMQLWREAAARDPGVPGPEAETMLGRTPRSVQRALSALSHSRFLAGVTLRAFIWDLKQVSAYLRDDAIRRAARDRLRRAIGRETRVVVAHSLGSVIAYETLCEPDDGWSVRALVTLGSPLGIRNVIFDRLDPPPRDGKGWWPAGVGSWFNIADEGDIVALTKKLGPLFDTDSRRVDDALVHNGASPHDVALYLTSPEAGRAVHSGLIG